MTSWNPIFFSSRKSTRPLSRFNSCATPFPAQFLVRRTILFARLEAAIGASGRKWMSPFAAELVGTMLMIVLGDGVVAAVVLKLVS